MNSIYADYAAATPTDPQVIEAMSPYLQSDFGNPSSLHSFGRKPAEAISASRETVANFIGASSDEIYFTASGTESNNMALIGIARANKNRGKHIVTSAIEHPSIMNTCQALEKDGFEITYVKPDSNGLMNPIEIAEAVRPDTILVSIHLANSEIGVVQSIKEISTVVKKKNAFVLIHTDACQVPIYQQIDVIKLGVDLLTFNGSKLYGPKGIATLFVKSGTSIFPIVYGGGQEKSLRSGTENVPGIVGLAKACQIATDRRNGDAVITSELRDTLQKELSSSNIQINCAKSTRLPNHLSVTLIKASKTDLVSEMDELGIAISSGSACSSKSLTDSHILSAIGLNSDEINKTLRITLGRQTTQEEIKEIARAVSTLASQ